MDAEGGGDRVWFWGGRDHDVKPQNGCKSEGRTAWLGVHPGTPGHAFKVHCQREGFLYF